MTELSSFSMLASLALPDDAVVGITGAAHGIGAATAQLVRACGGRVLMIDRDAKELEQIHRRFGAGDDEVLAVCCDVDDAEATACAIESAASQWGHINGWVNCAALNAWGDLTRLTEDEFAVSLRVNCLAAWRMIRQVLPYMRDRGGTIVNVSTVMTQMTYAENSAYTIAKGTLEAITRSLAVELAPQRIRVNGVRPGFIDSHRDAPGREPDDAVERFYRRAQPWPEPGTPEAVASTIVFLLSKAARFITGTMIDVDGGLSVRLVYPANEHKHDASAQAEDV